jgi:hypothetical protein
MDAITGDNSGGRRIADLRMELQNTSLTSFFSSADQLGTLVSASVQQIVARTRAAYSLYIQHMQHFAGAQSEEDAMGRYVPLPLQDTRAERAASGSSLKVDTWERLVSYPATVMLVADSGGRKTTSILHECQRLATYAQAIPTEPFPVYVSLTAFTGTKLTELLFRAADLNRIAARELLTLWRERQRPFGLFLDCADEVPDSQVLLSIIREMLSTGAGDFHSVVVACRPGPAQVLLRMEIESLHEIFILPLEDTHLDDFIDRYHAGELRGSLAGPVREVLRRPHLVAALCQAAQAAELREIPNTASAIFQLYVEQVLRSGANQYNAEYVQRPALMLLAHLVVTSETSELICDDSLFDSLATCLTRIHHRYRRRRQIMPADWTAEGLIDGLIDSSVLERVPGSPNAIRFTQAVYRDYFIAMFLCSQGPQQSLVRDLLQGPNRDGWYQALSIVLETDRNPGGYFEGAPDPALSLVAQLWIEHAPTGAIAPSPLREKFARAEHELETEAIETAQSVLHRPRRDSRQRYKLALALSGGPITNIDPLLDLAEDEHPIVRGAAQYALLRWGESHNQLIVVRDKGKLIFVISGGGVARIGPYTIVDLALPAAVNVVMTVGDRDIDPFACSGFFRFLYTPPELFAATFFEDKATVDWLSLLVEAKKIAHWSAQIADRARERRCGIFADLESRAVNFSAFGRLLAQDLGIPWTAGDRICNANLPMEAMGRQYNRLRAFFSRSNQQQMLLAARSENDEGIRVVQTVKGVKKASLCGVEIESITIKEVDPRQVNYAFVSLVQHVKALQDSDLRGLAVRSLRSVSGSVPLVMRVKSVITVERSESSSISSYKVDAFEGLAYPWKADIVIDVKRSKDTTIEGVVSKSKSVAS